MAMKLVFLSDAEMKNVPGIVALASIISRIGVTAQSQHKDGVQGTAFTP